MVQAVTNIQRFTAGISFEEFQRNPHMIHAVSYNFVILGEAANQIPDELRSRYPLVPWQEMRAMRNVVVHLYFRTSVDALWQTATEDLPVLVPLLQQMLDDES